MFHSCVRKIQFFTQITVLSTVLFSAHAVFAQASAGAEPAAAILDQVNINEADAETIADVLVGVGTSRATAIVEYRDLHGRFSNLEQLMEVKGIGEATVLDNSEKIRFE